MNPDFGQVEADPAEVNLTAFETFFEERRPFFTAGQDHFEGNGPSFFYSRRIGASPHGQAHGDFVDTPSTTTILGAAKLTGRLQSGLRVGALVAMTDDEEARAVDLNTGVTADVRVEPRTSYGVLRLQQQFGENASTIGLTMTGMKRDVDSDDPLSGILTENSFAGGLDWNKRWNGGEYELLGHAGYSWVGGDSLAMAGAAGERALLPEARRRARGLRPVADVPVRLVHGDARRQAQRTWIWNGGLWLDSPGFEINDVGQLNRADDVASWTNISYNDTEPGEHFRRWNVGVFQNANWNFDGVHRLPEPRRLHELHADELLERVLRARLGYSDPVGQRHARWPVHGAARRLVGGGRHLQQLQRADPLRPRSTTWQDNLGGWNWRIDPEFTIQPTDRLTLSVEPRYVRTHEPRQYITTRPGGQGGPRSGTGTSSA